MDLLPFIAIAAAIILVLAIAIQRTVVIPRRKKRNAALREIFQRFFDAENIQYVLVLTDTGMPLFSRPLNHVSVDDELVAGFLSATSSFGAQLASKLDTKGPKKKGFEELAYGHFKIVVSDHYNIRTALMLITDASESLKVKMREFNKRFYEMHEALLTNWQGRSIPEQPVINLVEQVFEIDLLYLHGVNDGKAGDHVKPRNKTDARLAVITEAKKAPFNGFFKIRAMIDALNMSGKEDVDVFQAIDRMRQEKVLYTMNPASKSTSGEYSAIIDALSMDARQILIKLKDATTDLELKQIMKLENANANVTMLRKYDLVRDDLSMTEKGEQTAYYISHFSKHEVDQDT